MVNLWKLAEGAVGLYLIAPGPEDFGSLGATALPSAALGAILLADAFGVKIL